MKPQRKKKRAAPYPWDAAFTRKILALAVRGNLLRDAGDAFRAEYFGTTGPRSRLAKLVEDFYSTYRERPGSVTVQRLVTEAGAQLTSVERRLLWREWLRVKDTKVPDPGYVASQAKEWAQKSALRSLVSKTSELMEKSPSGLGVDLQDLRTAFDRAISIGETHEAGRLFTLRGASDRIRVWEDPDATRRRPTGFREFDRAVGGHPNPGEAYYFMAPPKGGKAQPLTAKILLPDGTFVPMGSIRIGQRVASVDGRPSYVRGVYPRGILKTYRVEFSDGRHTIVTGGHLWTVSSCRWKEPRTVSTKMLARLQRTWVGNRMYVDTHSGKFGRDVALQIHPYALGALLGNGCFRSCTPTFSFRDADTVARLSKALPKNTVIRYGAYDYRIRGSGGKNSKNPLSRALRFYRLQGKLSHEKFIPEVYLRSSLESRLALLRGLLDTDGTTGVTGDGRRTKGSYSTSSKRLAQDVVSLVRSIGGLARLRVRKSSYTYKGRRLRGRLSYCISIQHDIYPELVLCERKKPDHRKGRKVRLMVRSIKPTGKKELCQCIRVSHPSGLYITDDFVTTHNSSLLLNIGAMPAIRSRMGVLWCSYEMSAGAMGRRIDQHIANATRKELRRDTESLEKALAGYRAIRAGELVVQEFVPQKHGCVEAAKTVEWLRSEGIDIDIVVLDYLNIMAAASGTEKEKRHQLTRVSRDISALAKDLKVGVWSAALVNRQAVRKKRIRKDDIAEAFEVIAVGDGFIAICADEEDLELNLRRLWFAAMRDEEDERSGGVYRMNFGRMRIRDVTERFGGMDDEEEGDGRTAVAGKGKRIGKASGQLQQLRDRFSAPAQT